MIMYDFIMLTSSSIYLPNKLSLGLSIDLDAEGNIYHRGYVDYKEAKLEG